MQKAKELNACIKHGEGGGRAHVSRRKPCKGESVKEANQLSVATTLQALNKLSEMYTPPHAFCCNNVRRIAKPLPTSRTQQSEEHCKSGTK